MTPQEREMLEGLFARIKGASGAQRDSEAHAFISEQIRQAPQAAYLLSQTVLVQEEALKAAAAKLDELNARIEELEDARQAAQEQPTSFLGGIGKSLFGGNEPDQRPAGPRGSVPSAGGARDYPALGGGGPQSGVGMPNVPSPGSRWTQQGRPISQAAPAQQEGGGGSFLKGALGAAAGVAGGMLLANSLSGLFKDSGNSNGIADAKGGGKGADAGEAQTGTATPASAAQKDQPWGADAKEETSSAADDGFNDDDWADAEESDDGWSDDD